MTYDEASAVADAIATDTNDRMAMSTVSRFLDVAQDETIARMPPSSRWSYSSTMIL